MKNIFRKSNIFSFILGAVIFGSIGAVSAYALLAKDVSFNPSDSTWKAKDVASALDELYERTDKVANDVSKWLKKANLNNNYTSINQVLADSNTLQILINNDKACAYLKISHDWAKVVTENETAMTYIGANDYCADLLYSDGYWAEYIAKSEYFEKILHPLVPTLTSNSSSNGQAFASGEGYGAAWKAFDDNPSSIWEPHNGNPTQNDYVGYRFNEPTTVGAIVVYKDTRAGSVTVEGSNDGTNWVTLVDYFLPGNYEYTRKPISTETAYTRYRVRFNTGTITPRIGTMQFYSR